MITLAVTGGIGSGKSAVCAILSEAGIPVYDSDSRTKSLYDVDKALSDRILEVMDPFSGGRSILDGRGLIDRRMLASIVFSDSEALDALESAVHPAVLEDFIHWRKDKEMHGCRLVAMESAIILEKKLFRDVADRILIVDAPFSLRLERACKRDSADRESILRRMDSQQLFNRVSWGDMIPANCDVIVNDSDLDSLKIKVSEYLGRFSGALGPDR